MADPIYTLGLELAQGSLTNVTTWCLRGSFGRAIADAFEPIRDDGGSFELANDVGSMSPFLNSNLKVGRRIQLTATYGGSSYNLFSGRVKSLTTRPVVGERTTVIEAVSEIDRVRRLTVSTSIFANTRTGSLFTELMSRSSVQSFVADADVDDLVPFAWYRDESVISGLEELISSGYYQMYVDGAGTFRLRSRNWDFNASVVDSLNAWYDLNDSVDIDSVKNRVRASAILRATDTSVSTVGYLGSPLSLPGSGSTGFFVNFTDPRNAVAETPVRSLATITASQDYYASANSDGTGQNYTSNLSLQTTVFGASLVCSIYNAGPACWLTRFQVRGNPILSGAELAARTDDSSSQTVYGLSEFQLARSLIADNDFLQDLTGSIVRERKEPRHLETLTLKSEFPGVLRYELGDVLSLVESLSGVNSSWFIKEVNHDISLAVGLEHTVTYALEQKPADRNLLVLDDPVRGTLDGSNVLDL